MGKSIMIYRRPHGYFDGGFIRISVWPTISVSPYSFHDTLLVEDEQGKNRPDVRLEGPK